jgi:hypothetical protein
LKQDIVQDINSLVVYVDEVASFRRNLSKLRFYVHSKGEKTIVNVVGSEGANAKNVCIQFSEKITDAHALTGKTQIISSTQSVVFDAFNGQQITIMSSSQKEWLSCFAMVIYR